MDTVQCAVLLAKLERFDWEIERRLAIGRRYGELLAGLEPQVETLAVRPDRTNVFAQYTIRCSNRDQVQRHLGGEGIPTAVHYPLSLHQQPAYAQGYAGQSFPNAERLAREVISLPMHPYLDAATQTRIADAVRASVGKASR
jgi:UDP-2-acetamido-2-deoxy-ribo-hexuluronate aminotransferase